MGGAIWVCPRQGDRLNVLSVAICLFAGHRQWWLAKSAYFDTMLLFKVGKFYEMYHMDAVIGVENLNLTYMRVRAFYFGCDRVVLAASTKLICVFTGIVPH